MKRSIYFCLLVFALSALGCKNNRLLNLKNPNAYNPEDIWNDQNLANAFLADLYASTMPDWPVNQGDWADESQGILGPDAVTPSNGAFQFWPYSTIRGIDILLTSIDGGSLPSALKDAIKGQAYFLRAFNYFEMVKRYGGVPIIKAPETIGDSLNVSRNSTKECFDFMLQDIDSAIALLPNRYTSGDFGKIDKAASMAYKGRILLYEASPQFNLSNPWDNQTWQLAYAANKMAVDSLESWGYGLYPDYNGIWLNAPNEEDVLTIVYHNPGKTDGRSEQCVRPLSQSKDCTGHDQPIWNLVASYPMKDGTQPGQSSRYPYDIQTFWKNRDPRFDATIIFNGEQAPWGGNALNRQYTDIEVGSIQDGFGDQELFDRTGFYCKKGLDMSLPPAQVSLNAVDWPEIRFAEVLLNFAETANETGHSDQALAVLKQIRQRASIDPGPGGTYGLKQGMSQSELREAIHFERYIEFAFEGKRFWDLRRWRGFSKIDGLHKYGLEAQLKSGYQPVKDNSLLSENFNYTVRELITSGPKVMSVPDSYYFFPIPESEMQKDPNLEQNSDWGGSFNPTLQ